ncbi:putative disease resistance protein RGA1 [Morella rubra]|uniref:Putative disease resistance protein RGA1 n=1 Tax=Morella rubra TaxID=262757 RepID=A0A6A1UJG4_9ROSI|nr:putative disease resistance protein RGA1 [Morella rubra]
MAEAVLFNTVGEIAKTLGSLALQEMGLLWGVKGELEKLRGTVSTIQAVLLDAEEQQAKNHAVKDWLGKLKDVIYDADDLLDDFSTEVLRREVMMRNKKAKEVRIFFSKSNQLAHGLKMGHKIKAVRERLDAIAADRIKFHFTERYVETRFEKRERDHTHSFVPSSRDECTIANPDAENVVERTRHVAFDSLDSLWDIPTPLLKAGKLRTFLLPLLSWNPRLFSRPWQEELEQDKPVYDTLISSFKCLRVLNLSNSNLQRVPNSIGKLKRLRYLDLSWNDGIQLLPASITNLHNLQTLRLDFCRGLKELPEDTRNLTRLRHLEGLEHLRSSPLEAKAANLKKKQYLQTLGLEWEAEDGDDTDGAIENDELMLENLQPHSNVRYLFISGYAGVRFSSWVPCLSNLVSMRIENCKWCKHIPPLDQFPFLHLLQLVGLNALEYISDKRSHQCSPFLRSLCLVNLPNLRGWWRMMELVPAEQEQHHPLLLLPSFPCLSELVISNCPKMSILSVNMITPAPWQQNITLLFLYLFHLLQVDRSML